ncbi:MAG: phosphomannomutase/phosphoglucomutase [Pseudomonadales bacterium]|jgi:phosphomannomutase/phosphoglucomutase|nr:phosphomannomutase/phosphoglucomutase [Pseudomonadales bacterium]
MTSSDANSSASEDRFEATAVGAVTPPLDPKREIPGRTRPANPFAGSRLGSAAALGVAGALVGTLLAAVTVLFAVVMPANRVHETALAESRIALAAARVDGVALRLQRAAVRLASAPDTLGTIAGGDDAALRALEVRYATALDDALRVRINPVGAAEIALTEVPPLTFSGLDLIRGAENGVPSGPEFLASEDGGLLNVAAPVTGAGARAAGSVMITFSAGVLADALRSLPSAEGRFSVLQAFGTNPPVEIAAEGDGGGGEPLRRKLAYGNWSIVHEPPVDATVTSMLRTLPAWLLVLLPALGAVAYGHRRLVRFTRADLERLVDSAHAMALGRNLNSPTEYALDEFAVAGALLIDLSKEVEGGVRKKAPTPTFEVKRPEASPPPGVEVEELLDIDDDPFLEIDEDSAAEEADSVGELEDLEQNDDADLAPDEADIPPDVIFRDYDVRGIVGEQLTEVHAELLGRAFASAVAEAGETAVAVAADCRPSSPALKAALVDGITAAGIDVVDIGEVPTPVLYHTTSTTAVRSGVVVTGSHSGPEYNGFKLVIAGETLASGRIGALRERIRAGRFASGAGSVRSEDAVSRYVDEISGDIAIAQPLKVVVDCGNGIAGPLAPRLLEALGCEVLPLYCDPDGRFPNHHPDPADPRNLEDLATVVRAEGADLGIALDGDGDRIGAVDEKGRMIWPDRLMMLFARDIVGRNPGADVVFDVKCSRHLNSLVAEYGGRPIMWKTGHAHLKAKMRETGALLGGEFSGHISFGERWHGFDDGLYSAARLLEIIASEAAGTAGLFESFPAAFATPEIRVPVEEGRKFAIVEKLIESGALDKGDVSTIDGLRVDYPDGWGLVRASNTEPALTLRFEADTAGAVREIAEQFRIALRTVDPSLDFTIEL